MSKVRLLSVSARASVIVPIPVGDGEAQALDVGHR
jgi:hypothetical protein